MNVNTVRNDNNDSSGMLRGLLLFYVPLGLYSMIMMTSHSVMNLGVSRAANAEIGLAAFSVVMNIMNMFASPCFTSRQLLVTFAHDKKSLAVTRSMMIKLGGFSLIMLALLALTPIGDVVFVKVFNTPANLLNDVRAAAVLTLSLPFIYTLRSYAQGILIVAKKTQYLTYTVVIRILFMIALAFVLPQISVLTGAMIGIMIWTSGMALEAVINYLFSRGSYNELPEEPDYESGKQVLTTQQAFTFIWPLLVTSFIWTLGLPMINSGLGRTSNPELALATFQVSRNYVWIILGFIENNMRQVPLIFGTSEAKMKYLKKFNLGIGVILMAAVALLALTPVGNWGLLNIIGVSESIANASRPVLIVLIALPVILAYTEFYTGLLMKVNNTKALSIGKVINLSVTIGSVITMSVLMPQLGATAAAIAVIIGYVAELVFLYVVYEKYTKIE